MLRIKVTAGDVVAFAELNETSTAEALWNALPIEAQANTWGDEIYFSIPVYLDEEDAQAVVEKGDLGYRPVGNAFASSSGARPPAVAMRSARPVRSMSSGTWRVIPPSSGGCAVGRK